MQFLLRHLPSPLLHSLSLPTFNAHSIHTVYQSFPSTQSESEQSLVLEDLCLRFLFLFLLSFFFSFLFFLFLLRWWSEEEEEPSESEEVVSWSSCCSCWILPIGTERWTGEEEVGISTGRTTQMTQSQMPGVGKHLKCPWARDYLCPSAEFAKCLLVFHISSNCHQKPKFLLKLQVCGWFSEVSGIRLDNGGHPAT